MSIDVHFHVEVDFGNGKGWQRNGQQHQDIEKAKHMASFFTNMAKVRLVKRTVTEEIIGLEDQEQTKTAGRECLHFFEHMVTDKPRVIGTPTG